MNSRKYYNRKYKKWLLAPNKEDFITFFTPTYKRPSFIKRIYECLISQTDKRFVWILVNDGSGDNTDEVATEFLEKEEIPMLFISKSNGGKHSAFEVAFTNCESGYFQCMDDDDLYSPYSVHTFLHEWERIKREGMENKIGAIRTISLYENGNIVASKKLNNAIGTRVDQTTYESNFLKHEHMENWTCYRTSALRCIELFPKDYWMHDQHKFYTEQLWQGRFARKFLCRYYFVPLREYRFDDTNGLTRGIHDRQHYMDMFINFHLLIEEQLDWYKKAPLSLIKIIMVISILRDKLGVSLNSLINNTTSLLMKLCFIFTAPIGLIVRKPKIDKL